MIKRPTVKGLLWYVFLTAGIGFGANWLMDYTVESVVGHTQIMQTLANQLQWCDGNNALGFHLLSEDQAKAIYQQWDGQPSEPGAWGRIVGSGLRLTTFMDAAQQAQGGGEFVVLFAVLGITGLVVFIKATFVVAPWRRKESSASESDLLTLLDPLPSVDRRSKRRAKH